jgi:DNA-binding protein HU-beta
MTKKKLIEYIHHEVGLPKNLIGEFVEATFEIIKDVLRREEAVKIVHFGKWEPVLRKGKQVRHPVSKKIIQIPERKSIAFRASSALKRP